MRERGGAISKSTASLAVATAILAASLVLVGLIPRSPANPTTGASTSKAAVTLTSTNLSSSSTNKQGVPPVCVGPDYLVVESNTLNYSGARSYLLESYAFSWPYTYGFPQGFCTFPSLLRVALNVTGKQVVTGNWTTGYSIAYVNNSLLTFEMSPNYKIVNMTTASLPDRARILSFNARQQQVIAVAVSNSSVKLAEYHTGPGGYYVAAVLGPIPITNQTVGGDYYVVLNQINSNNALGVYVNSSISSVVIIEGLHNCRYEMPQGNYCYVP